MSYLDKLRQAQQRNNSWLCLGLDPQPELLPVPALKWDEPLLPFNRAIIDATTDLVCAYKPNLGFYLQWGAAGVIALERTIAYIPDDIPVILDAKIGDIGHTQAAWGHGLFDVWNVDAVTVNPYVGAEAVRPLLAGRPEKAVYVLARTSNRGAQRFQGDLVTGGGLAAEVLRAAVEWARPDDGHCGFVVGATSPPNWPQRGRWPRQPTFSSPASARRAGTWRRPWPMGRTPLPGRSSTPGAACSMPRPGWNLPQRLAPPLSICVTPSTPSDSRMARR